MSYTLDGNGEVMLEGDNYPYNSDVLTYPRCTPYDLAKYYNKTVTAKVNGGYVGWACVASFIHYKHNQEHIDTIEEITYWNHLKCGEFCRFHCMLLVSCGEDSKQYYSPRLTELDNEIYITQYLGKKLPKTKKQKVTFKSILE